MGRVEGYDEALQCAENQASAEEVLERAPSSLFNTLVEESSRWPLFFLGQQRVGHGCYRLMLLCAVFFCRC